MATPFHVELVTPERILFSGEADEVSMRTDAGEIAFLAHHEDFIGAVDITVTRIHVVDGANSDADAGEDLVVAVHGGFVHVHPEGVRILASVAELASEIDVERARAALAAAEADAGDRGAVRRARRGRRGRARGSEVAGDDRPPRARVRRRPRPPGPRPPRRRRSLGHGVGGRTSAAVRRGRPRRGRRCPYRRAPLGTRLDRARAHPAAYHPRPADQRRGRGAPRAARRSAFDRAGPSTVLGRARADLDLPRDPSRSSSSLSTTAPVRFGPSQVHSPKEHSRHPPAPSGTPSSPTSLWSTARAR